MKLNWYESYAFHSISKIKKPFKLWLKTKKQGRMRVENEWTENGMYEISEADDNPEFIAWLRNKRAMDRIRQQPKDNP